MIFGSIFSASHKLILYNYGTIESHVVILAIVYLLHLTFIALMINDGAFYNTNLGLNYLDAFVSVLARYII